MQTQKRVVVAGLAAMIGLAGGAAAPAQAPALFPPLNCGPGTFPPGDIVLNVGRVDRGSEEPSAVVVVRFVDGAGDLLLEDLVPLLAGQSRALSLTLQVRTLVRAEVVSTSGDGVQVRATLQGFHAGADGVSYGPHFLCSGDTIDRPIG